MDCDADASELANTSSMPPVSHALREYVTRSAPTPPFVASLPSTVKSVVDWMQSGDGVGHCRLAATPEPTPGPSMRMKLVLYGLPVMAPAVTPSPRYPAGALTDFRNGPMRPLSASPKAPGVMPTSCVKRMRPTPAAAP